jgi:hypothetical protein
VLLEDGTILEDVIENLNVVNAVPMPTRTPQKAAAVTTAAAPVPTEMAQTPTSLPVNPLRLSQSQIAGGVKTGAVLVLALMFLLLLYRTIRKQ